MKIVARVSDVSIAYHMSGDVEVKSAIIEIPKELLPNLVLEFFSELNRIREHNKKFPDHTQPFLQTISFSLLEETGEVGILTPGDYSIAYDGNPYPYKWVYGNGRENSKEEHPILKLTEYPSNPLQPIVEVWEKWKYAEVNDYEMFRQGWQAISQTMKILEDK